MEVEIQAQASKRILLHSLKHPHGVVIGVLLGNVDAEQKIMKISQIIPVFHNIPLSPFTEAAFEMIEDHCCKVKSEGEQHLSIVGVYSSSSSSSSSKTTTTTFESFITNISEKISKQQQGEITPLIIVIDNKCDVSTTTPLLYSFISTPSTAQQWKRCELRIVGEQEGSNISTTATAAATTTTTEEIESKIEEEEEERFKEFIDFEEYLSNTKLTWI